MAQTPVGPQYGPVQHYWNPRSTGVLSEQNFSPPAGDPLILRENQGMPFGKSGQINGPKEGNFDARFDQMSALEKLIRTNDGAPCDHILNALDFLSRSTMNAGFVGTGGTVHHALFPCVINAQGRMLVTYGCVVVTDSEPLTGDLMAVLGTEPKWDVYPVPGANGAQEQVMIDSSNLDQAAVQSVLASAYRGWAARNSAANRTYIAARVIEWVQGVPTLMKLSGRAMPIAGTSLGCATFAALVRAPSVSYTGYINNPFAYAKIRDNFQWTRTGGWQGGQSVALYSVNRLMVAGVAKLGEKLALSYYTGVPLVCPDTDAAQRPWYVDHEGGAAHADPILRHILRDPSLGLRSSADFFEPGGIMLSPKSMYARYASTPTEVQQVMQANNATYASQNAPVGIAGDMLSYILLASMLARYSLYDGREVLNEFTHVVQKLNVIPSMDKAQRKARTAAAKGRNKAAKAKRAQKKTEAAERKLLKKNAKAHLRVGDLAGAVKEQIEAQLAALRRPVIHRDPFRSAVVVRDDSPPATRATSVLADRKLMAHLASKRQSAPFKQEYYTKRHAVDDGEVYEPVPGDEGWEHGRFRATPDHVEVRRDEAEPSRQLDGGQRLRRLMRREENVGLSAPPPRSRHQLEQL